MRRLTRMATAALVLGVLLAVPTQALAFTQRTGDTIVVDQDTADDLYLFGSNIEVSGDVDGDVVAFGSSVRITGDVRGGVVAAGENVTVSGKVDGSVRAAGSQVSVEGDVGGDVVAAGNNVRITSDGSAGRDAVLAGATIAVQGGVSRNLLGAADRIDISAAVGGDVTADVSRLTVTSEGRVGGDVTYYSDNDATIDGTVAGATDKRPRRTRQSGRPSPAATFAFHVFGWIRGLIGLALFAMLVLTLARPFVERSAREAWFGRPGLSVAIGFGIFVIALPIAGLVFVLGLLAGGWWIAVVWLAVVWLLMLVGLVVGALAVGRWLTGLMMRREVHPVWSMLLGVLAISAIGVVPFLGWLAGFVAMLLGAGAMLLALYSPPGTAAPNPPEAPPAV